MMLGVNSMGMGGQVFPVAAAVVVDGRAPCPGDVRQLRVERGPPRPPPRAAHVSSTAPVRHVGPAVPHLVLLKMPRIGVTVGVTLTAPVVVPSVCCHVLVIP